MEPGITENIAKTDAQTLKRPSVVRGADFIIDQSLQDFDVDLIGNVFAVGVGGHRPCDAPAMSKKRFVIFGQGHHSQLTLPNRKGAPVARSALW